ncbi:uncharacterized protein LOC143883322 isoform X2 [Tasmannia lanceolata]|uniref:uncharacterized protein LOC143883322 isoform X2 n=1 Tax=Tasmannia lanceolata TaxID=3420 RepID=UPI004064B741
MTTTICGVKRKATIGHAHGRLKDPLERQRHKSTKNSKAPTMQEISLTDCNTQNEHFTQQEQHVANEGVQYINVSTLIDSNTQNNQFAQHENFASVTSWPGNMSFTQLLQAQNDGEVQEFWN